MKGRIHGPILGMAMLCDSYHAVFQGAQRCDLAWIDSRVSIGGTGGPLSQARPPQGTDGLLLLSSMLIEYIRGWSMKSVGDDRPTRPENPVRCAA
jgi:hypothetical protein